NIMNNSQSVSTENKPVSIKNDSSDMSNNAGNNNSSENEFSFEESFEKYSPKDFDFKDLAKPTEIKDAKQPEIKNNKPGSSNEIGGAKQENNESKIPTAILNSSQIINAINNGLPIHFPNFQK